MKKLFTILACSLFLNASTASAQIDVVRASWQQLTAAGEDLSDHADSTPCNNFKLVRLVASRIPGAGYLQKPNGTHCDYNGESYAKDIVAFSDGRIFDIVGGGQTDHDPYWNPLAPIDPSRFRAARPGDAPVVAGPGGDTPVSAVPPGAGTTPLPTPGICLPFPDPDVPRQINNIYQQNERIFANLSDQLGTCRLLQQQTFELLKRHDEEPMFVTKLLSNRYVQLGLAGLGTWLAKR